MMKEVGKETLFNLRELLQKRREELKRIARELEKNVSLRSVVREKLKQLACVVAGVDGGCYVFEELSISLLALRAASAIMTIDGGKVVSVEHVPAGYIAPKVLLVEDDEDDAGRALSIQTMRVLEEVALAKRLAENKKPDILFLHGPLLPHFLARAATLDSGNGEKPARSRYRAVLQNLAEIVRRADESGMVVAGVVEDSRGRTLLSTIEDEVSAGGMSDTAALDIIMRKNQYTMPVLYTNPAVNNTLSYLYPELRRALDRVFVFYLKNAEADVPIRIEFYKPEAFTIEETAEKIARSVVAQTLTSTYSVPAVLVEADRRARITKKEAELLLLRELGSEALKLVKRRKRRFV